MDLKIDLLTKKEEGRKLKKTNHCEYKLVFFHWPSKDSLISISNFNFDFHWDFSLSLSLSLSVLFDDVRPSDSNLSLSVSLMDEIE